MKKFIYKTNQYLLERFPTVWNTRLVWMLLTAIVLHFIFFVFGFFTLSNPTILQERYVKEIFFNNGTVFLTTIISILLLVGWLIYMFKNNAFKNFYPSTGSKLFGQFMCYMLIIFSCSTFYLSYNYGIKTYIASTYSDTQINKEIETANDAALFFSESVTDYTINKRRYPKPFYEIYCETTDEFIDYDKHYVEFQDQSYQFYTLYTKEVPLNERYSYNKAYIEGDIDSTYTKYVYSKTRDSIAVLYFKDSVIDVKPFIKTAKPSYYNNSSTFFISIHDTLKNDSYDYNSSRYSDYEYQNYSGNPIYTVRNQLRNQRNYELLERNDKAEITALLSNFLKFSDYYKIKHNLTAEKWTNLVYNPDNYEVKNFIRTQEPKNEYDFQNVITTEQTKFEKFYTDHVTDFYFEHDALSNVFENIEDIKDSNPFMDSIHFFIWFSFIISCLIFMFRITGLKPLLFSIITVGVLALFFSLMAALLFYIMSGYDDNVPYVILYLILFISTLILALPIFFIKKVKKSIVTICLNISIIGFPLYLLLIIGIITMHQMETCRLENYNNYYDYNTCDTLIKSLEFEWSYVLFFLGILFILFYSKIIKKWKSLPEG